MKYILGEIFITSHKNIIKIKKNAKTIDVKKEIAGVIKKLDKIENDPKILEEAEQFQKKLVQSLLIVY